MEELKASIERRASGSLWPGQIDDDLVSLSGFSEYQPQSHPQDYPEPQQINLMDGEELLEPVSGDKLHTIMSQLAELFDQEKNEKED